MMSKAAPFANNAFQPSSTPSLGFNIAPQVNSFNSLFEMKPLNPGEAAAIEKLLLDNVQSNEAEELSVASDSDHLKKITAEIKAIGRQGVLLIGERVFRARALLKPYKDGTFTHWLEATFDSRKSGYNVLAYYELYHALCDEDLRYLLQKLPKSAAYILASRNGEVAAKSAWLRKYGNSDRKLLVAAIREAFPASTADKRAKRDLPGKLLSNMAVEVQQLQIFRAELVGKKRIALVELINRLKQLL